MSAPSQHAFYIDSTTLRRVEEVVRSMGAVLVCKQYACWISYYYQAVFPTGSSATPVSSELPIFSVIDDGSGKTFVVSDVTDMMKVSDTLVAPLQYTDITEMDYTFFDKVKIFNLKNKRIKKLSFVFSKFEINNTTILLGDNFLFIDSPVVDERIFQILSHAESAKNLNKHFSSLRLKKYSFQFYLYWLSRHRDTITIPTPVPPSQVAYADCVFAKDLLLA
jgi:hypothetical protein